MGVSRVAGEMLLHHTMFHISSGLLCYCKQPKAVAHGCFVCIAEAVPTTKRTVAGPREGLTIKNVKPETITAIPYDIIKEGLKT